MVGGGSPSPKFNRRYLWVKEKIPKGHAWPTLNRGKEGGGDCLTGNQRWGELPAATMGSQGKGRAVDWFGGTAQELKKKKF